MSTHIIQRPYNQIDITTSYRKYGLIKSQDSYCTIVYVTVYSSSVDYLFKVYANGRVQFKSCHDDISLSTENLAGISLPNYVIRKAISLAKNSQCFVKVVK